MNTYLISYWKPDTKALGDCGRIHVKVEATDMFAALVIAKSFVSNPASYSWLAEVNH